MLKHHLNLVCDEVWERLSNSKTFKISQGEETLTDNLLLYLASKNLSSIKIIKTPKSDESIKGTDWEWWIGNQQSGYLRYAVQAKKLDLNNGRYTSLNHKVGNGSSSVMQHDVLEKYAIANKAIPLYAFYNHIEKIDYSKEWNCPLPMDISKLGCTVTPLKNVKTAIANRGGRTFEKLHHFKETIPLRCLAICPHVVRAKAVNKTAYIEPLGVEATIYQNPTDWLTEISHMKNLSQMPAQFYNHELGYYPKRILLIDASESESNNL